MSEEVKSDAIQVIRQKEFDELVKLHNLWFERKEGGKQLVLENVILSFITIKGAYLPKAVFYLCELDHVKFIDCDLMDTKMDSDTFEYCEFEKCQVVRTNLGYSSFKATSFDDSTIQSSEFSSVLFLDLNTFDNCKLEKVTFYKALFHDLRFTDTFLKDCIFTQTEFSDSFNKTTSLSSCDFTNANVVNLDEYKCPITFMDVMIFKKFRLVYNATDDIVYTLNNGQMSLVDFRKYIEEVYRDDPKSRDWKLYSKYDIAIELFQIGY